MHGNESDDGRQVSNFGTQHLRKNRGETAELPHLDGEKEVDLRSTTTEKLADAGCDSVFFTS